MLTRVPSPAGGPIATEPPAGRTTRTLPLAGTATTRAGDREPLRVALVNMPFFTTRYPSMALGLLHAILAQRGFEVATHDLTLRFGERIGWELYEALAVQRCYLLGEWIFAAEAFRDAAPEAGRSLAAFGDELNRICTDLGCGADRFLQLREQEAPAFLDHGLAAVHWQAYDVVAFGSVFDQNCAALALARRLKERYPGLIIVFGGANFGDEMGLEYMRAVPWIDYAVLGEGDEVFPALLERIAAGEDVIGLPGVACRAPTECDVLFSGQAPMVRDLDALPEPCFDSYFTTAAEVKLPGHVLGLGVRLPFESSRGCWWGQKHHCTFCGLNGLNMAYRSKSPARLLAGIDELAGRYNFYAFEAVDNILDLRYVGEVFGKLAERRLDYVFYYETKANLKQDQLRTLVRGGLRKIQPGIESLSTHVLELMRKGVTAIQNVRVLKWAAYYNMDATWNVLTGFPGERPEDYEQQLATMRLIPHLSPPQGVTRIHLERYSPYANEPARFGFTSVSAYHGYRCVYPDSFDYDRIAYLFDYEAPDTLPDEFHEPLRQHVRRWHAQWYSGERPTLSYLRGGRGMVVMDNRVPEQPRGYVYDEPAALIYDFCGPTYHGVTQILAQMREEHGLDTSQGEVEGILEKFTSLGLMMVEDGHYLSLALPSNPNW